MSLKCVRSGPEARRQIFRGERVCGLYRAWFLKTVHLVARTNSGHRRGKEERKDERGEFHRTKKQRNTRRRHRTQIKKTESKKTQRRHREVILTSIHYDSRNLPASWLHLLFGSLRKCNQQVGVRSGRSEKSELNQVEQVFDLNHSCKSFEPKQTRTKPSAARSASFSLAQQKMSQTIHLNRDYKPQLSS